MAAHLYVNPKGIEVTSTSYSSTSLFKDCARRFQYEKILGWRRKDNSAALSFGRAFEAGLQQYHDSGLKPDTGVDHFKLKWLLEKENTDLKYSAPEGDWQNLYHCGAQLLKLYEVLLPTFPIREPLFQARLVKEVFPGTELAGIEDQGFVDIISRADWHHPMLQRVDKPKGATYRPLYIDVKTAGKSLDTTTDLLALDPQLRRYAWLGGVQDIAFLWAVKCIVGAFQKGTEVTILEASGKWTPGERAVVLSYDEETSTVLVSLPSDLEQIEAAIEGIKGKGSTEAKRVRLAEFEDDGTLTRLPTDVLTKAKLQFVSARISEEDMLEEGKVVARTIVDMVQAREQGFYAKNTGVRFPNNHCTFCSHRGLCLKNDSLRDSMLVQITPATPEEDWLTELEEV